MAKQYQFYVYEILDDSDVIIYVGKGSGRRINASLRHKAGAQAREVARFYNEEDAYDFEVEHIAATNPCLNKHIGGNGSRSGFKKGTVQDKDIRLMNKIGTRAFAARMLISYYLAFKYISSKVDNSFSYGEDVAKTLSALDINKLYEVGYGARA